MKPETSNSIFELIGGNKLDFYSNALCTAAGIFSKPMKKVSDTVKNAGFIVALLLIFIMHFFNAAGAITSRYLYRYMLCCLCLGVVFLCSIRGDVKPIKFSKSFIIIWLLFGIMQFISGLKNDVNYLPEAMLFLVVFPALFVVWQNMGFDNVARLLIKTCIISFYVFGIVSIVFFPYKSGRYQSFFSNPNGLGGYCGLVLCCIYVSIFDTKHKGKKLWYTILLYICAAFLLLSGCRTAMLASAFGALAVLVMSLSKGNSKKIWSDILLIIIVGIVVILCFFLLLGVAEKMNIISEETLSHFENSIFSLLSRSKLENKTMDDLSSGRVSVWQEYIKKLNLFGHPDGEYVTYKGRDGGTCSNYTCHNYVLQMSINHGLITGAVVVAFMLYSLIQLLRYASKNKGTISAQFSLILGVSFFVSAMFESLSITFNYMITLYFYFALTPIAKENFIKPDKTIVAVPENNR